MATPDFILALRERVGTMPLWLSGVTACVHRETGDGTQWLLARRADDGRWTSVTGIVDPGEHPADAAVREVAEESGVRVEMERLIWLDVTNPVMYDNGDETQYINFTFRCAHTGGKPHPADGENVEVRFFAEDALPEMTERDAAVLATAIRNQPECGLTQLPR